MGRWSIWVLRTSGSDHLGDGDPLGNALSLGEKLEGRSQLTLLWDPSSWLPSSLALWALFKGRGEGFELPEALRGTSFLPLLTSNTQEASELFWVRSYSARFTPWGWGWGRDREIESETKRHRRERGRKEEAEKQRGSRERRAEREKRKREKKKTEK